MLAILIFRKHGLRHYGTEAKTFQSLLILAWTIALILLAKMSKDQGLIF